jgi:hypothetical protein
LLQRRSCAPSTFIPLALARRAGLRLRFFKCGWFDEKDYFEFFPLKCVFPWRHGAGEGGVAAATTSSRLHGRHGYTRRPRLKNRHLDITPKAAAWRVNGKTHPVGRDVDIGNVNRRHLRAEVKYPGWGDGLSAWSIHSGKDNPVFLSLRSHEIGADVRIEKRQKPSAQIAEA